MLKSIKQDLPSLKILSTIPLALANRLANFNLPALLPFSLSRALFSAAGPLACMDFAICGNASGHASVGSLAVAASDQWLARKFVFELDPRRADPL